MRETWQAMKALPAWVQITMGLAGVIITSLVTLQVSQTETLPANRAATLSEYSFVVDQLRAQSDRQAVQIEELSGEVDRLKQERRAWQTEKYEWMRDRSQMRQTIQGLEQENVRLSRRVTQLEEQLGGPPPTGGTSPEDPDGE